GSKRCATPGTPPTRCRGRQRPSEISRSMADAIDTGAAIVQADAADIFISYARSDRARVAMLARHLQAKGLRVWWDPEIPPGEKFDRVIARALVACKIVLVVWSPHSIDSDWVLNEADEGRRRKILLPVLLDTVEIPLG